MTKPLARFPDGSWSLVGNFRGTFYLFKGEGKGKFSPKPVQMELDNGKPMKVQNGRREGRTRTRSIRFHPLLSTWANGWVSRHSTSSSFIVSHTMN